jgi:hypothetical protein
LIWFIWGRFLQLVLVKILQDRLLYMPEYQKKKLQLLLTKYVVLD